MSCAWIDLGCVEYEPAFAFQQELHRDRCLGRVPDTIIIQENPPVITIGRTGSRANLRVSETFLADAGVRVLEVDRGGDVTYHGPGQLVISVVVDLRERGWNLRGFVFGLEQVLIHLLAGYGIAAARIHGLPGVWVGTAKIAAVGLAVRHGVTFHGIALNVRPDLSHFDWIIPCGLHGYGVTAMERCLGAPVDQEQVKAAFLQEFGAVFEVELQRSRAGVWL